MPYLNSYYYKPPQPTEEAPQQPSQQQSRIGGALIPAVTGALQIGGDIYAANQAPRSIQTQSPGLQPMDEFGTPAYNLGGQASYINNLNASNYGRGLGVRGLASGAQAGAAIGGIPGAIAGGLIGGAIGLFGRGSARRKARRKIRVAKSNFRAAQRDFNEANISATQNRLGREQYNDMLSDPYGINGGYF